MPERISTTPGCLTFAEGRVPDNDSVPEPPRPAPPPTRYHWLVFWSALVVVALGVVVGVLRSIGALQ